MIRQLNLKAVIPVFLLTLVVGCFYYAQRAASTFSTKYASVTTHQEMVTYRAPEGRMDAVHKAPKIQSSAVQSYTEEDVTFLAKTIWAEARGEKDFNGMLAVGEVIMNRVSSSNKCWPNTIKEVVLQNRQFSCWNKRDPNRKKIKRIAPTDRSYQRALRAAREVLEGRRVFNGAPVTHYHVSRIKPHWAQGRQPVKQIGGHMFYTI